MLGNIERLRAGRDLGTEIFLISPDGRRKRKLRHPIGERPIGFVWAPDAQSVFYNLAAIDRAAGDLGVENQRSGKPEETFAIPRRCGFLKPLPVL